MGKHNAWVPPTHVLVKHNNVDLGVEQGPSRWVVVNFSVADAERCDEQPLARFPRRIGWLQQNFARR